MNIKQEDMMISQYCRRLEFTCTQIVVRFVGKSNKTMQRHGIYLKTQFEKNHEDVGRIHYFHEVTVNFAELEHCGSLKL